jgi:hypothetical protein
MFSLIVILAAVPVFGDCLTDADLVDLPCFVSPAAGQHRHHHRYCQQHTQADQQPWQSFTLHWIDLLKDLSGLT